MWHESGFAGVALMRMSAVSPRQSIKHVVCPAREAADSHRKNAGRGEEVLGQKEENASQTAEKTNRNKQGQGGKEPGDQKSHQESSDNSNE
jgi:hypothetical protein